MESTNKFKKTLYVIVMIISFINTFYIALVSLSLLIISNFGRQTSGLFSDIHFPMIISLAIAITAFIFSLLLSRHRVSRYNIAAIFAFLPIFFFVIVVITGGILLTIGDS